jgi:hypothetical protein
MIESYRAYFTCVFKHCTFLFYVTKNVIFLIFMYNYIREPIDNFFNACIFSSGGITPFMGDKKSATRESHVKIKLLFKDKYGETVSVIRSAQKSAFDRYLICF